HVLRLLVLVFEFGRASLPVLDVDQTHVVAAVWHLIFDLALVLLLPDPYLGQVLALHVLLDEDLHRVLAASPAVVRTGCFPDEVPHRGGRAAVPSVLALPGTGCCEGVLALVLARAWALALAGPALRQA